MTDLATMLVEDALKDETMEIVINAINKGLSIDVINDIIGLTVETIKRLQAEFNKN